MDRQRWFIFQATLKQLQIVFDDVNNYSDAEAISISRTESIVDDYEVPLKQKLSDVEVFDEGNEDASSKDDSTVRSEFAYYVTRILNGTVPAYPTVLQFNF